MKNALIRNAIRTPDGTVLESRFRHDYQWHVDATNGLEYMVDGGLDYVRRTLNVNHEPQDLTVMLSDGHAKVREAMTWGTYGPNGDQPLQFVKLMDMTTEHIQACLDTVPTMIPQFRVAMQDELAWRANEGEWVDRTFDDEEVE